ncbi:hypothetical protein Bbelb_196820 [Branchiostoma belcheri]|nr:hypothetical protein Bbelb_196820 [Branchiostoma belcheri]
MGAATPKLLNNQTGWLIDLCEWRGGKAASSEDPGVLQRQSSIHGSTENIIATACEECEGTNDGDGCPEEGDSTDGSQKRQMLELTGCRCSIKNLLIWLPGLAGPATA